MITIVALAALLPVLVTEVDAFAAPVPYYRHRIISRAAVTQGNGNGTGTGTIIWGDCDPGLVKAADLPIKCAELVVPLDYTAPPSPNATATHTLELVRVQAATQPARGSVLFNFGGPGSEGLRSLATSAQFYRNLTGGAHDLIGFNPRGTSLKYLPFSCYGSDLDRALAILSGMSASGGPYLDSSDVQPGRTWATAKVFADACADKTAETTAGFVGTAFVARDIMRIVDALGQGELVNFYGISYGTVLGATLAAMFPDRIGRMVIDGVLNPHEYYHNLIDTEWMSGTDESFRRILAECVKAGPARCALAGRNNGAATASQIEKDIYGLFERLKHSPLPLPQSLVNYASAPAAVVDYSNLKGLVFSTLYVPAFFPKMAAGLDALLRWDGDSTNVDVASFGDWRDELTAAFAGVVSNEALQGIRCGDKDPATRAGIRTLEDAMPAIERVASLSRLMGNGSIHGSITMPCARWRLNGARERYNGDFRVRTKYPVLVVNPTWDPVTPLVSAKNVSAGFEGSVLLQRDGFGHSSVAERSACSEGAIGAYFSEGKLPTHGTVCKPDKPVF
ncbi:hypothetical protein GGTG_04194 [Gaeumannomyces tritici R3-111a-1]|uniref:Peptidase S33 tripeptidyl aminopeptidase-like C-terminal domain-containing protein n=1 Tax=Gaeumannomyces tritici (strain R3-111a-1) TaxID=644352 RepID=J3NSE8_GAET3|nr:hypothetical protein GGTG_04194 [Gaeumannomyces tritici R3-111a-1]EJT79105.1 hypothetical protein GGTG_04194 [Gaeumannomyces tritici R3-111a-1]